jgi:hypothetical protein
MSCLIKITRTSRKQGQRASSCFGRDGETRQVSAGTLEERRQSLKEEIFNSVRSPAIISQAFVPTVSRENGKRVVNAIPPTVDAPGSPASGSSSCDHLASLPRRALPVHAVQIDPLNHFDRLITSESTSGLSTLTITTTLSRDAESKSPVNFKPDGQQPRSVTSQASSVSTTRSFYPGLDQAIASTH